jgi:hypothetical protein
MAEVREAILSDHDESAIRDAVRKTRDENGIEARACDLNSRCGPYCSPGAMGPDLRTVRTMCRICRTFQTLNGNGGGC